MPWDDIELGSTFTKICHFDRCASPLFNKLYEHKKTVDGRTLGGVRLTYYFGTHAEDGFELYFIFPLYTAFFFC